VHRETETAATVGVLDPDIVDYTKSPVHGLTAAKVRAAVEGDKAKLEAHGLYVDGTPRLQ